MKIKLYLFTIFIITLIALGTWFLILFNINPYQTDIISRASFFVSLLIWITGILSLILFYLRIKLSNKEIIFAFLPLSVRQSFLFSLSLVLILILSSLNVLTWWSAVLAVASILILDLFFKTRKA